MKEEQFQIEREFINSLDIREVYRLTDSKEKPFELLAKFKSYLIENGFSDKRETALLKRRIKELNKEVQQHRDTNT